MQLNVFSSRSIKVYDSGNNKILFQYVQVVILDWHLQEQAYLMKAVSNIAMAMYGP